MNPLTDPNRIPARLPARAQKYARKSKAKNTITAYNRCWKDFAYYCEHLLDAPALPASPESVCTYIAHMADDGKKVSTIKQRLAAISYRHRINGLADPTHHPFIAATMEGICREVGTAPIQQAPLVREDVRHLALIQSDGMRGLRDSALLLVGFAGAFRESELVALNLDDLVFEQNELLVTVRKSKTDQTGEGVVKHLPLLSDANALFCPVRALRAYLIAAEIASGPVFRKVDRWGKVWQKRLLPAAVAYIVKRAVSNADMSSKGYAGHSLRAGFVTQAANDNIPLHEIQEITLHQSSDMVRRYIRNQGLTAAHTISKVLGE